MVRVIWWLIVKALIKISFSSKVEASHSDSSKLLKFYGKKDQTQRGGHRRRIPTSGVLSMAA